MTCLCRQRWEAKVSSELFATSARKGVAWAARRPESYPRERAGSRCVENSVDLGAGFDGQDKPQPHRDSIPDRPARRVSLYRQRYFGRIRPGEEHR